jgi:hypothetical protein
VAVGFVWYLSGPVADAKINMDSAGLSVGTVALSERYKKPRSAATWLNTLKHKSCANKVPSSYARGSLCGANCCLYLSAIYEYATLLTRLGEHNALLAIASFGDEAQGTFSCIL